MPQELPEEIQTALFDLQRYLLDQIPPITAWDSIATLMEQPPQLFDVGACRQPVGQHLRWNVARRTVNGGRVSRTLT